MVTASARIQSLVDLHLEIPEAIYLSTFALISKNRQAAIPGKRAVLELQAKLLAEEEVTRLLVLADGIPEHLGLERGRRPDD